MSCSSTRGESVRDTAYVLSRHVAAIGIRTGPDELVAELAELRDGAGDEHAHRGPSPMPGARGPADAARDVRQARGPDRSPTSATATTWRGRWRSLGAIAGVNVRIASPPGYELEPVGGADLTDDPREAVHGRRRRLHRRVGEHERRARVSRERRRARPGPTASTTRCSTLAAPGAIALHCLPAHPGEEITAEVLYGERQRIWDQAENRRHAQKALLELLPGA